MADSFHQLKIWQKGYDLLMEIYDLASKFPKEERFSLMSQITRSGNGVIANIAEAHGRYHYADKIRILYIARGELEETQSHLRVALGRKYINQNSFDHISREYEDLIRSINQYINFLFNRTN
jgi:four helix bundle protein